MKDSKNMPKVVGNVASNFADLVVVSERIELGIKRGKFVQSSNTIQFAKKPNQDKKKGEANAILLESVLSYGRGKPTDSNSRQRAKASSSPNNPTTISPFSILAQVPPLVPTAILAKD
ncbi:hypothetical protein CR513_14912, partial [Mucuna pruriens]